MLRLKRPCEKDGRTACRREEGVGEAEVGEEERLLQEAEQDHQHPPGGWSEVCMHPWDPWHCWPEPGFPVTCEGKATVLFITSTSHFPFYW